MKDANFNANSFIESAKQCLPQYLNSLEKKEISGKTVKFIKTVLLIFLKDYSKNCNSKFNRTMLDIDFINKFLHEIIPNDHFKLAKIPISKIQAVLVNFVNFLTLKQVLNASIKKQLVRSLNEKQIPLKRRPYHGLMPFSNYEDEDVEEGHDSEDFKKDLEKQTEELTSLFLKSNYSNKFTPSQREDGKYIILRFTDYLYDYFLLGIQTWNADALEEVCLELFPRKISAHVGWFKAVYPVLTEYFNFLREKGMLKEAQTIELQMRLYEISDLIVEHATDPNNWGMAKAIMMDAVESGIDMDDEEQMNLFLKLKMWEHNSMIDWGRNSLKREFVESLSNEEIIVRLREDGVNFDEKRFLEDVNQLYSVNALVLQWEEEHEITAQGYELDFIWMAACVLWNRLAPDVVNSEQIDEYINEGYQHLYKKHDYRASKTWLKAWSLLKKRFFNDIDDIYLLEERFNGCERVQNWVFDFFMVLWNANLFEESIEICQELADRFPKSSGSFLHNILRYEADAYFELDRFDEGENLYKKIVEQYPDKPWGYIGWGDKYADPRHQDFDPEKARELFLIAAEVDPSENEKIEQRISFLEKDIGILKLKTDIISQYREYLMERKTSKKSIEIKIKHAETILKFICLKNNITELEEIMTIVLSEDLPIFLGFISIKDGLIRTEKELTQLCQSLKTCFNYLHDELMVIRDEDLLEMNRILNSKAFFMELLEVYQELDERSDTYPKDFNAWRKKHLTWKKWFQTNVAQKSHKVRLSKKKRALFKDIDESY